MNRWNIPDWLEKEVRARDGHCIYCGAEFAMNSAQRRSRPSWEHIINDVMIVDRENIALCCIGCNASKGSKPLTAWLQSRYCESHGITVDSIAEIARAALALETESRNNTDYHQPRRTP